MGRLKRMFDRARTRFMGWRQPPLPLPERLKASPAGKSSTLVIGGARGGKRDRLVIMDESSPLPDQAALAAHAKALAAAEAEAERAAPIHRFKDGAEVVAKDGQRYVASNVQKNGWHVSMTLRRTDRNRNDGLTGRQRKRAQKAARRQQRERQMRRAIMVDPHVLAKHDEAGAV